jgi:hypothetical protein
MIGGQPLLARCVEIVTLAIFDYQKKFLPAIFRHYQSLAKNRDLVGMEDVEKPEREQPLAQSERCTPTRNLARANRINSWHTAHARPLALQRTAGQKLASSSKVTTPPQAAAFLAPRIRLA